MVSLAKKSFWDSLRASMDLEDAKELQGGDSLDIRTWTNRRGGKDFRTTRLDGYYHFVGSWWLSPLLWVGDCLMLLLCIIATFSSLVICKTL